MQPRTKIPANVPAIAAFRLKARSTHPYYSSMFYALIPVEVKNLREQAHGAFIAVDKFMRLYYDPDAIQELSVEEGATALIHEVNHPLRGHMDRAESYAASRSLPVCVENHRFMNACEDAEINDDLAEENLPFPKGYGVLPSTLTKPMPNGKLWEEYADGQPKNFLVSLTKGGSGESKNGKGSPQDGEGNCKGIDCGSVAGGGQRPWELDPNEPNVDAQGKEIPKISQAEQEIIAKQVARDIQDHVKNRGTVPNSLKRWADAKLKIKYDPRRELAAVIRYAVMEQTGMVNYTWKKFSKRAPSNIFLPGLSAPVPKVRVVVDTSGSMTSDALGKALVLIQMTLKSLGSNVGIDVIACDAHANACHKVFKAEMVNLEGGGGTDMRIGVAAAAKQKPFPDIIILVTDGYTPWPTEPTKQKLIVALVETDVKKTDPPAWARVIHLDEE